MGSITRKKILDFIYFAGIFLILYWIFVLLFDRLLYNKAKVEEWEMDWGILRSSLWRSTDYYLAPFVSFIIASALSGVIHASHRAKRFLWAHTLIFIAVFWFIDTCALQRQASMWDNYPTNAHELTASILAIIITVLISSRRGKPKEAPAENRKFYCSHCGKEISYDKYRYQVSICDSCSEASCMG